MQLCAGMLLALPDPHCAHGARGLLHPEASHRLSLAGSHVVLRQPEVVLNMVVGGQEQGTENGLSRDEPSDIRTECFVANGRTA